MSACPHPRRQIYRRPFVRSDGTAGCHLVEKCLDCGGNARGPGVWVPRSEAPDPDALPELPPDDRQEASGPRQRGLFEDL